MSMSFTISDLILETLESAGVRRVYGLPGDSLNGFTDVLRRTESIAWAHVRHEEAAACAASGEAAVTVQLAYINARERGATAEVASETAGRYMAAVKHVVVEPGSAAGTPATAR